MTDEKKVSARRIHVQVDGVRIGQARSAKMSIHVGTDGRGLVYVRPHKQRTVYYCDLADVAEMVVSRHVKRGA